MRAVEITAYGGPEVVRLAERAQPVPAYGQVLVRVRAAGVNPVDWKIREGYMRDIRPLTLPEILGTEAAGQVVALGGGVTQFAIGDRVHGGTGAIGAFADYVVFEGNALAHIPDEMSFIDAAALPVAAVTAVAALDSGGVGTGSQILIHAASGGVGSIALQLAVARGADVTAVASSANHDFVRRLGATHVIDRSSPYETDERRFDMVLDAHGPDAQARSWNLLREGGIMISLVAPPDEALAGHLGVRAMMVFGAPDGGILAHVDELAARHEIIVTVARTYPIEHVGAALAESQAGHVRGKLVLTFDGPDS